MYPMVQKALARQIVVKSQNIRNQLVLREPIQFPISDFHRYEAASERVLLVHTSAEQVKRQPTTLIFEISLISKLRCAMRLSQIFSLDQLRARIYLSDFCHCQNGCAAFVEQSMQELAVVFGMRIPMAIKRAEAGSRERLIYRRISIHPRIALCYSTRIFSKQFRKVWIEKIGSHWAAAVMEQSNNRPDAEVPQPMQPLVRPCPVNLLQTIRGHALP